VGLTELLQTYEPINISPEGYIVVRDRPMQFAATARHPVDFSEIGATGATSYSNYITEDYNADLRHHLGTRKYDQMRRSDAQVRASLRLLTTPIHGGRWYVEPASDSVRDRNVAEFIHKCLTEYMSVSWEQVLHEALLMLDFGYYPFELVFEERVIDGQRRIVWKKWSPRHPLQVTQWYYDNNGGPESIDFNRIDNNSLSTIVNIGIGKMIVFTNDMEAGNITGISVLRSAYKHWYFKDNLYKIDAIQKERHGIGIPVIILPMNFSDKDAQLADQIGRNLRVNEKAHVVLPPMWDLKFAKIEGQPVDAIASIDHHNKMIMMNILGSFIDTATGRPNPADYEVFLKASRYIADVIASTVNQHAVKQLVDYNFSRVGYPKLRVRRVGETTDWRALSFAIRNLIGADVMRADDTLEAWARNEMDLPMRDPSTDRKMALMQHNEDRQDAVMKEQADLQMEAQQQQAQDQAKLQKQQQQNTPRSSQGQSQNGNIQGHAKSAPNSPPPVPSPSTGSKRVGGASNNSA
jgi:hypothetical protein